VYLGVGQNNKRKITESGEEKKREERREKMKEKIIWSGDIEKKKCNIMEKEGRKKSIVKEE
jgi:hypothetical protein